MEWRYPIIDRFDYNFDVMSTQDEAKPIQPDVVVVEDNEDDARITLMALRRLEPRPKVELIVDGAAAVEALVDKHALYPRLVLLDLKLPRVHGLDVLQAIRGDEKTRGMSVVMLTSSSEPSDVARANELGCQGYLTKPIDWQEYLTLVCEAAAKFLPPKLP